MSEPSESDEGLSTEVEEIPATFTFLYMSAPKVFGEPKLIRELTERLTGEVTVQTTVN